MKKVFILFGLLMFLSSCGGDDAAVEFNTKDSSETGIEYHQVLWSDNIDLVNNELGPCNSTEMCYEVDKPITEIVLTTRMPEESSQRGQDANCYLFTGPLSVRATSDQFVNRGVIIDGSGEDLVSMAIKRKETVTLTNFQLITDEFAGQSTNLVFFAIGDCNHVQVSVSTE